jgi:hypothetical protein
MVDHEQLISAGIFSTVKSKLVNKAIQDIGMGSYNWQLFVLCGMGWLSDNLWLQGSQCFAFLFFQIISVQDRYRKN